jgi:hypothetical protein
MTASTPAAAQARRPASTAGELGVEDEGVEGDVALHPVGVEEVHGAREGGGVEVGGARAGVEALEAEVDGVGAGLDGGAQGVGITCGSEHLWARPSTSFFGIAGRWVM